MKCFNQFTMLLLILMQLQENTCYSQDTTQSLPDGTNGFYFQPRNADNEFAIDKKDLAPNEFVGTAAMFRIGAGYIGDFTAYAQSDLFRQQMDSANLELAPNYQTRDFRMLFSGRFLKTKRYVAYKFAYMYDGDEKVWLVRESGLTIGAPELKGHFFIGRTKEGFSMIKVMNGHSGINNERQMALDPIPILADGIKYFGYLPKSRIFINLGIYTDILSVKQAFSTFSTQYDARIGWLPVYDEKANKVMHVAVNLRYGKPLDNEFVIKSRPESNPTPQLINTGKFSTNGATSVGGEINYRAGKFMIASEVIAHNFYSKDSSTLHFYGGDLTLSYFLTKTSRPYNTTGNIYGFVPVHSSVLNGGWGEWEAVLHVSTFNLNNGYVHGGQMTRITPMINWYLTKVFRMEFIYGYGILDRFNLKGNVQFFEARLQISLL
ncbi:MAG: OprO/OprP family phosphate-selective porin [Chitinophagales bacterium]|nr:OprO/OprP family phosphate-selective porin [Chitinophagales bacterium]